ncbi:unnamed protein product [Linum trigynum]|uniref:Reverse transcriptase n=1 Tax=Linum trigynum TaxID=586398 RepID=A0AAV2CDP7_9ROSI
MAAAKDDGGLGMRDLVGFNTALLAKQMWRLYQREDYLISRILRAKYHNKESILEARVGHQPSFIWRSLLSAQEFLNEGLRWRIGNGSSVRIWGDKWLPTEVVSYVESAPRGLPVDSTVRELICEDEERWDVNLLENCFPSETVSSPRSRGVRPVNMGSNYNG